MLKAGISNTRRKAVYRRDHYRCALCDSPEGIQVHHVISRSQGGSDRPENLITLCWRCHAVIHGTRLPERPDWMDAADLAQACIEYVADLYAGTTGAWWPWSEDYSRQQFGIRKRGGG